MSGWGREVETKGGKRRAAVDWGSPKGRPRVQRHDAAPVCSCVLVQCACTVSCALPVARARRQLHSSQRA